MSGKVVTAFSCSVKVKQICDFYNLEQETVKIGFKHIWKDDKGKCTILVVKKVEE